MRVVKYQRCSTDHQEIENQTSSIDQHIERMGWNCVGEYKDVNQSGMKSRDSRPQLRQLLQDSKSRQFDFVVCYDLSRMGRSTVDVINTINELQEVGVNLFVIKNSIDTSTSQGKMFSYFISIFSEMERDLLLSRQSESIKRLREKGSKWGRGKLMSEETKSKIIALRQEGFSYRKICESVGVSKGSIQHLMSTVNG
jgi:DNA invertase Pin-like site-specific DNA recombinase|tara:strand:- start:1405 stop:1995 length:591 start_codon:yes stop_codon:yes gene_type:complete